jgi:signal transduction histidine kinase
VTALNWRSTTADLRRVLAESHATGADRRTIESVLELASDFLFSIGFSRTRYYKVSEPPAYDAAKQRKHADLMDDRPLFLLWQRSVDGGKPKQSPGYRIYYRDTTLNDQEARNEHLTSPVAAQYDPNASEQIRKWVADLDLVDRAWIDIPVINQGKLEGMIAVDWPGATTDVTDENLTTLSLFSSIVASELARCTDPMANYLQEAVAAITEDGSAAQISATELLIEAISLLVENLDIAVATIFRYDWTTRALTSVKRIVHSTLLPLKGSEASMDEVYDSGQFLTGKAWEDEAYTKVIDFDNLRKQKPDMVYGPSVEFHQQFGGRVRSVLYGKVGTQDARYMVRLINRASEPEVPLFFQENVFEKFLQDLSPLIENQIQAERATLVTEIATIAAADGGHDDAPRIRRSFNEDEPVAVAPVDLAARITGGLRTLEAITDPIFIAQRGSEPKPHFVYCRTILDPSPLSGLKNDAGYRATVDSPMRFVITRLDVESSIAEILRPRSPTATHIVWFPFRCGLTRGVVVVPMRAKSGKNEPRGPGREVADFVYQLGFSLGQALEIAYTSAQADGAIRALSLVGHEMTTPLAALRQAANTAVIVAKDEISTMDTRSRDDRTPPSYFSGLQREVDGYADQLRSMVHLGYIVGRGSDEGISGFRRSIDVRTMINRSTNRTSQEHRAGAIFTEASAVDFRPPSGTARRTIVCEKSLVETALTNIYRNAVKYSVPRDGYVRVTTAVSEQEKFLDIAITNFGKAIPPEFQELIFARFVRMAHDMRVYRRGMGLGLHLARQIARAHDGDVYLDENEPQSDDRSSRRRGDEQRYRTTFRLRLRKNLKEGEYDHRL